MRALKPDTETAALSIFTSDVGEKMACYFNISEVHFKPTDRRAHCVLHLQLIHHEIGQPL